MLKWRTKFAVDVMELCSVELVQIEGMSMTEAAAPPTDLDGEVNNRSRLNMYMLMFTRPKRHERTVETSELYHSIC